MNNFTLQIDVCEVTLIEAYGNKGSVNGDKFGMPLIYLKNAENEAINGEIRYRQVTGTYICIFVVLQ
jgi:hypothetical protein